MKVQIDDNCHCTHSPPSPRSRSSKDSLLSLPTTQLSGFYKRDICCKIFGLIYLGWFHWDRIVGMVDGLLSDASARQVGPVETCREISLNHKAVANHQSIF